MHDRLTNPVMLKLVEILAGQAGRAVIPSRHLLFLDAPDAESQAQIALEFAAGHTGARPALMIFATITAGLAEWRHV